MKKTLKYLDGILQSNLLYIQIILELNELEPVDILLRLQQTEDQSLPSLLLNSSRNDSREFSCFLVKKSRDNRILIPLPQIRRLGWLRQNFNRILWISFKILKLLSRDSQPSKRLYKSEVNYLAFYKQMNIY